MLPLLFLTLAASSAFAQTPSKLPPLAPPHGELPPTFWEQHGATILIAGLTFILLAGLLVWRCLQPKPEPVLPPEIRAREALEQLVGKPEDGRLLSQASQILRRYVAAVFELAPPEREMTTAEFCRALSENENVGNELADILSAFARECDERKFAPVSSASPLNVANRALELVSRVEARREWLRTKTVASA